MKYLFLFLCACTSPLFAQPGSIQVSVSDTIEVLANHISVAITFQDTSYTDDEPTDFTASREEVLRLLASHKIAWKKTSEQMGFMSALARMNPDQANQPDNDLTADFSSVDQLHTVLPNIEAVRYVRAVVTGNSVDKEQVDLTRLYAKLLKKAQAKAEMIAGLTNRKVIGIEKIGSDFDAFNPSSMMEAMTSGGSAYGEMMKSLLGNMFSEKRDDHKVAITEHLTVTFSTPTSITQWHLK